MRFELLSGELPFCERGSARAAPSQTTALRRDPAERHGGVPAFIEDLEHWLAHRPVSVRRHAVLAGAAALTW